MFRIGNLFGEYETWDNRPGGKVVETYILNGTKYVDVVFENSPRKRYRFYAP